MAKCLFLDDDEGRHGLLDEAGHEVWHVRTAEQAIKRLGERPYDFVSLDHDLGGEPFQASEETNTGYQVAKHIAEMETPPPVIRVHSYNPAGAKRMMDKLRGINAQSYYQPFNGKLT